jgi:thioester reductase-like protein
MTDSEQGTVLTGGTGFLGGEVLARLLERDERPVYVLIRAEDDEAASSRLKGVLESLLGSSEPWGHRAVAVRGDVTRAWLGMSSDRLDWLAERTDRIIHCAASVSFEMGLDDQRRINVDGTRRMLELAGRCARRGGLEAFAHVSTAYVAGTHPGRFGEEDLDVGQDFRNAYERTKFEAELLVRERGGGLPIQILRPSIVVGDSTTGWTPAFNVLYGPMKAFARGAYPAIPARASSPVDVVPADFVADAIIALAGRPRTTFNLTAGSRASTVGEIVELASAEAGRRAPRIVPPGLYRRIVHPLLVRTGGEARKRALRRSEVYFPYFAVEAGFEAERTRAALAPHGIEPPPLRAYFDRLLAFARAADWGRREVPRHQAGVAIEEPTREQALRRARRMPPRVPVPGR